MLRRFRRRMAPQRSGRGGRRGFTLVELMVAVSITAATVGAIYGVFTVGFDVSQRGARRSRLSYEANLVFDAISRDVRGAFDPESQELPAFAGDAQRMEFFTTGSGSGRRTWPARRVSYSFSRTRDAAEGEVTLEEQPFAGTSPLVDGSAGEVLVDRVRAFRLRYYKEHRWLESWQEEGVPPAVEVEIEIAAEDSESTVKFTAVIDVPAGGEKRGSQ